MNIRQIVDSQQQDNGLGDTIKRATVKVGLKPCDACQKRAQELNKKFPYREK